jgi:DNA-binding CsgD family transcriptional regulator
MEASNPDSVLAVVESGLADEAEELAEHIERRARRPDDPWAVGAAALCRGLVQLGSDDVVAALDQLTAARARFDAIGAPWELAHTLLAEGHALRRSGRRTDAAESLTRAAALFDELAAAPWRERAEAELRRARPRPRRDDTLTAAESRVAVLVAGGGTNKEVAATLFTTVATVEAHLTRIYRKLGLRSRSELARAVADGEVTLDA